MTFRFAIWKLMTCIVICVLISNFSAEAADGFPAAADLPARAELPDPLKMFDGTVVTSQEQWYQKRRPELKALFQHYMYGNMPPAPAKIEAVSERVNPQLFGGKATKREISIKFGPPDLAPIQLLLIVPNQKRGPAPVFVGLNFCGNHAVLADPGIAIPKTWMYKFCPGCVDNRATEAGRGGQAEVWSAETLIDRGYALATFYNGDIDPDEPNFAEGIHRHYLPTGQTEAGPHDWGAVAAWAWGLSRAVDYLVTDQDIDKSRICAIGHSRLGKTALLAAAFDERIALVVPHQSGTGGAALSRHNDQETVKRITTVFPHWFTKEFSQFGDNVDKLPIDQHLLMALVAPRPLLDTEGLQDKWANFDNAFNSLQAADQVYKFLGAKGLVKKVPVVGEESVGTLADGELMQYRRDTTHVLNRDYWNKILDFADTRLAQPKVSP